MKRLFSLLFLLLALSLTASAKSYTVENIPVTTSGDSKFVLNPDHIISADTVALLNSMLKQLEDSVHVQVAIVVIDSFEASDDYTFAIGVARRMGVGSEKQDNGLLILLATGYRAVRMVTGSGLEDELPDAICKRIQINSMNPYFAKNQWGVGLVEGTKAIYIQLEKTSNFDPFEDEVYEDMDSTVVIAFIVIMIIIIIALHDSHKCPRCKTKMKQVGSPEVRKAGLATRIYTYTYVCPKCGHRETKEERVNIAQSVASGAAGSILGGLGGGRGGRSGGGHSWGGGHFGGGGAGSRF